MKYRNDYFGAVCSTSTAFISGSLLGAGLMYLFDPDRGRGRRAMLRDKTIGAYNDVADAVESKGRDIKNRSKGLVQETKNTIGKTGIKAGQEIKKEEARAH